MARKVLLNYVSTLNLKKYLKKKKKILITAALCKKTKKKPKQEITEFQTADNRCLPHGE